MPGRALWVATLFISGIAVILALQNAGDGGIGSFLAGIGLGVAIFLPLLFAARRHRLALLQRMAGRPGTTVVFVAATAYGTFLTETPLVLGPPYPYDSPRSWIGVVVRENGIELWNSVPQARPGPALVFAGAELAALTVVDDDAHGARRFWLRWETPAGPCNLGLVPRNSAHTVRWPLREADSALYLSALQTAVRVARVPE